MTCPLAIRMRWLSGAEVPLWGMICAARPARVGYCPAAVRAFQIILKADCWKALGPSANLVRIGSQSILASSAVGRPLCWVSGFLYIDAVLSARAVCMAPVYHAFFARTDKWRGINRDGRCSKRYSVRAQGAGRCTPQHRSRRCSIWFRRGIRRTAGNHAHGR